MKKTWLIPSKDELMEGESLNGNRYYNNVIDLNKCVSMGKTFGSTVLIDGGDYFNTYRISFILEGGSEILWNYKTKEERDKDYDEILQRIRIDGQEDNG